VHAPLDRAEAEPVDPALIAKVEAARTALLTELDCLILATG
jgi:hypothetical protein